MPNFATVAKNIKAGMGSGATWCVVLVLIAVVVVMYACSSTTHWKEEVQLSDGRIIVLERVLLLERGGDEWASNRSGSKPKEYGLRFEYPHGSGKMIAWRSAKVFETWPEIPLILDVESGAPVVFAIVGLRPHCEMYSKYLYQNGAWVEQALPESFETRSTNLLLRGSTEFVSLETKRTKNAESGYRRAIQKVGPTRQVCG